MAFVSDLVAVGLEKKKAAALGDEFGSYSAAGTTVSDATQIDPVSSIVYIIGSSGVDAGLVLPTVEASHKKQHLIYNANVNNSRIYVSDPEHETIIPATANGVTGDLADFEYINVGAAQVVTITKVTSTAWIAY